MGHTITAVPAPKASINLPSLTALATSSICNYLSVTLNLPQDLVISKIESLVTPGKIYPSSNLGVTNSLSPYSFTQKKKILEVPTSQTYPSHNHKIY